MGSPEKAAALFFEKDLLKRDKLAAELLAMNQERKKIEDEVWNLVEDQGRETFDFHEGKLALVYGEKVFRGVTGLIAQRLVKRFKVPGMAVSFGDNTVTGSLRSAGGYELRPLMEHCADLFIDWGGHPFAGGFSMEKSKWDALIERLKTAAYTIEIKEEESGAVAVDAELPHSYLSPDIFKVVDCFEPYGNENEPLVFMTREVKVQDIGFMGNTEVKHVKMTVDTGKHKWPAVYWQAADKVGRDFDREDTVDMVFNISRNRFKGAETPQLIITDLRKTPVKTPDAGTP
jgi:single-stranded-DNA-specific exonuclease